MSRTTRRSQNFLSKKDLRSAPDDIGVLVSPDPRPQLAAALSIDVLNDFQKPSLFWNCMSSNDMLIKSSSDSVTVRGAWVPHTTEPNNPASRAQAPASVIVLTFRMLGDPRGAEMYLPIWRPNSAWFHSEHWDPHNIVYPLHSERFPR